MNFIHKQHFALIKVTKDRGEISRSFDGRTRANPHVDSEFIGNNLGQCGFA